MKDNFADKFVKMWRAEVASRKKHGTMHTIDEEIRRLKAGEVGKGSGINLEQLKDVKK